jgi:hypothetical protein
LAPCLIVVAAGCSEGQAPDPPEKRSQQTVDRSNSGSGGQGNAKQQNDKAKADEQKMPAADRGTQDDPLAALLLDRLKVSAEVEAGYERDLFYHWKDLGSCDVREEVLARQDRRKGPCGSDSGRWFSVYDGVITTDPGDFDVDHMVPLAEAWASGARRWPETRRDAFANDLEPYSLIAVSASSNRSKSDQDPAEWMPENESFACPYVARWIAVKFRWRLSVDRQEKGFLEESVSSCDPRALTLKAPVERSTRG